VAGRGRILFGVLVLVTLFADGIGLGIYVTSGSDRPASASTSPHDSLGSPPPTAPGQTKSRGGTPQAPARKPAPEEAATPTRTHQSRHMTPHLVRQPYRPHQTSSGASQNPDGGAPSGQAASPTGSRGCHPLGYGAALHRRLIGDGPDSRSPGWRRQDGPADCDHPVWGRTWGHLHQQWSSDGNDHALPDWSWRYDPAPRTYGWHGGSWARHGHRWHRSHGHR
jgi:hypothetical protein